MRRAWRLVGLGIVALAVGLGVARWTGIWPRAADRRPELVVDERHPAYRQFRQRSRRILETPQEHESIPMPAGHEDRG